MLKHVVVGWAWLENNLNTIIDALNEQKPLSSASIAVDTNVSGSLLRVVGAPGSATTVDGGGPVPVDQPWKLTPDGETAGWHKVAAFGPGPSYNLETRWIWGGTPTASASLWDAVIVIDTSTCVQRTIYLLQKP